VRESHGTRRAEKHEVPGEFSQAMAFGGSMLFFTR